MGVEAMIYLPKPWFQVCHIKEQNWTPSLLSGQFKFSLVTIHSEVQHQKELSHGKNPSLHEKKKTKNKTERAYMDGWTNNCVIKF